LWYARFFRRSRAENTPESRQTGDFEQALKTQNPLQELQRVQDNFILKEQAIKFGLVAINERV
jgi:hypothetical protein